MAVVTELPRVEAVGSMSLGEVREQLAKLRRGGRIEADDRTRLHGKMKDILRHLVKVGQKGGEFAQIQLSDEMAALYQRDRWA